MTNIITTDELTAIETTYNALKDLSNDSRQFILATVQMKLNMLVNSPEERLKRITTDIDTMQAYVDQLKREKAVIEPSI